jgi:protein TonB
VFDTPPPPNAIQQVQAVAKPAPPPPPAPAAKPAPPPPPALRSKPKIGRRFKEPDYPPAALRAKESGQTRVSVCVDVEGRMSQARVVASSGSQRLDDAAIKALNGNRLDPAIGTDGKPIAMCNPPYEFTYEWRLPER